MNVPCPSCGKVWNVPDAQKGRQVRCGGCKTVFAVPATAMVLTDPPGAAATPPAGPQAGPWGQTALGCRMSYRRVAAALGGVLALGLAVGFYLGMDRAIRECDRKHGFIAVRSDPLDSVSINAGRFTFIQKLKDAKCANGLTTWEAFILLDERCKKQGGLLLSKGFYAELVGVDRVRVTWPMTLCSYRPYREITLFPAWECNATTGLWKALNPEAEKLIAQTIDPKDYPELGPGG